MIFGDLRFAHSHLKMEKDHVTLNVAMSPLNHSHCTGEEKRKLCSSSDQPIS